MSPHLIITCTYNSPQQAQKKAMAATRGGLLLQLIILLFTTIEAVASAPAPAPAPAPKAAPQDASSSSSISGVGVAPVLLISFDGFRASYLDHQSREELPNLNAFWEGGVRSAITPRFVSKTFPNHYSLVTGLDEENHGVVGEDREEIEGENKSIKKKKKFFPPKCPF